MGRTFAPTCLLALGGLALCVAACDEAKVTAGPEPPASAGPSIAPAPPAVPLAPPSSAPSVPAPPTSGASPGSAAPAPATATAAAPLAAASSTPGSGGAAASPARALDASKKPASNLTNDEVCQGAPREGCIPKNDPFGFVARE